MLRTCLSGSQWLQAGTELWQAVRADYASVQANRAKYHQEQVSLARLPLDAIRKIGFQQTIGIRLMQAAKTAGLPLAPALMSRLLRHAYSIEVHWNARIAPGISIVHGNGLVISHAATIGPGCILFHNVTLGEGLDAKSRARGAPTLERDVHVGPGVTLLGPITVGAGSKIGAGAVLDQSVPPNSVVMPAEPRIGQRKGRAAPKRETAP